jgi:hypothetical protein
VATCANCGQKLTKSSRYCPRCGNPSSAEATKELELPQDETGHVPVEYARAEPHYYGVTPMTLVLVLAGVALALAVVLLATGRWPFGLIFLGVSVLLVLVFLESARRRPEARVVRSTTGALNAVRVRGRFAAEALATRGRAASRVLALRRELQRMRRLRAQLLFELGDAVYRGDKQRTKEAHEQVKELDELASRREAEMKAVVAQAEEGLRRRQLEVQPTEMVELPQEPAQPGEGDPAGPAVIPEQYPPPDEGNPPQPAIIPEPSPAVIPEPGPQGPEGEERR